MTKNTKSFLWVLTVYALSFICYVPMLLRRSGAAVPGVLLYARYFYVLIPALVSAVFLAGEHAVKARWFACLKKISAKECILCAVIAAAGVLSTWGYSLRQGTGLFRNAYPSPLSFASSAVYLFVMALAEELAWRGFLLKRFATGRNKALSAGCAGVIWAVWHIPMWTIRNSLGLGEVVPLFIWTVLVSLILGTAYFRFENLLSAAVLHAIFNVFFLAPAKYNNVVVFAGMLICFILLKYKKGIKEF